MMTEWRSRRRLHAIMVACLALEAIMKDQVEQIGVAATAMGIDQAEKNRKVRNIV